MAATSFDSSGAISNKTIFFVIQTQSHTKWGLLHACMMTMQAQKLEIIDHRSWHPRGVDETLVSEAYVQCHSLSTSEDAVIEDRIADITEAIMTTINQPTTSTVKVQRWHPGSLPEPKSEDNDDQEKVRRSEERKSHSLILLYKTRLLRNHCNKYHPSS